MRLFRPPTPPIKVLAIAFSLLGDRLIAGSRDGAASVWAVPPADPCKPLVTLRHEGQVRAASSGPICAMLRVKLSIGVWRGTFGGRRGRVGRVSRRRIVRLSRGGRRAPFAVDDNRNRCAAPSPVENTLVLLFLR